MRKLLNYWESEASRVIRETSSSTVTIMKSQSGFSINVSEHEK